MIRLSTFQRQYGRRLQNRNTFPIKKREVEGWRLTTNIDPARMELTNACDYILVVTGN